MSERRTRKRPGKRRPPKRRLSEPPAKKIAQLAAAAADGVTEGSSDEYPLRPSHWRYLRGKIDCLENGLIPNTVNLAKRLNISRIAVWKLQRRYPWLDRWVNDVLTQSNAHYWGLVERRMAMTAMQGGGSPQHAEVFCRMRSGGYAKGGSGDSPDGPMTGIVVNNNILVPRPDMALPGRLPAPALPAAKPAQPAPASARPAIPTVSVR